MGKKIMTAAEDRAAKRQGWALFDTEFIGAPVVVIQRNVGFERLVADADLEGGRDYTWED